MRPYILKDGRYTLADTGCYARAFLGKRHVFKKALKLADNAGFIPPYPLEGLDDVTGDALAMMLDGLIHAAVVHLNQNAVANDVRFHIEMNGDLTLVDRRLVDGSYKG